MIWNYFCIQSLLYNDRKSPVNVSIIQILISTFYQEIIFLYTCKAHIRCGKNRDVQNVSCNESSAYPTSICYNTINDV